MFRYDTIAQQLASELLASHEPKTLPWNHHMFVCVALMHSEDTLIVERARLELATSADTLTAVSETEAKPLFLKLKHLLHTFQSHIKVLRQFNRYPHRNALMGRVSTAAEMQWLQGQNIPSWARSVQPLGRKPSHAAQQTKIPTLAAVQTPLRVLVLHGNRSNLTKFRRKTKAAFAPLVRAGCILHFVAAPHLYAKQNNSERNDRLTAGIDAEIQNQPNRCWWTATDDPATMVYHGLPESIRFIEALVDQEGPFDGVLGFAQGATMATILAALQEEGLSPVKFKFVISISGFYCRDTRPCYAALHAIRPLDGDDRGKARPRPNPLSVRSFHTWGQQDELIEGWRSELLSQAFLDPVVVSHPAGLFMYVTDRQRERQKNELAQSQCNDLQQATSPKR
jgi:hypothetical protein